MEGGGTEKKTRDEAKGAKAEGQLEDKQLAHLGAQLREMYDDLVQEPVPDRLLALLDDLDKAADAGEGDRSAQKRQDDRESE